KDTVLQVNKTVKEAEEKVKEVEVTKKEAEAVVQTFHLLSPEPINLNDYQVAEEVSMLNTVFADEPAVEQEETDCNRNEKILKLYRQGKTQVAIAQELGLGVGEVKLVIDLYQKM
uniref:DUF6115 domain-containing protein n=1 Tax=Acetatifactor sp. TaxID=1872090 RepID=UPI004055B7B6